MWRKFYKLPKMLSWERYLLLLMNLKHTIVKNLWHTIVIFFWILLFLVCGITTCTLASTKANCATFDASCASSFYTGTYQGYFTNANGQRLYAKAADINGTPWQINGNQVYLILLFVSELNQWTVSWPNKRSWNLFRTV